jgi:hypothetical protein
MGQEGQSCGGQQRQYDNRGLLLGTTRWPFVAAMKVNVFAPNKWNYAFHSSLHSFMLQL